ncbi:hypothetical protein D3C87_1490650 [compost metagenome]
MPRTRIALSALLTGPIYPNIFPDAKGKSPREIPIFSDALLCSIAKLENFAVSSCVRFWFAAKLAARFLMSSPNFRSTALLLAATASGRNCRYSCVRTIPNSAPPSRAPTEAPVMALPANQPNPAPIKVSKNTRMTPPKIWVPETCSPLSPNRSTKLIGLLPTIA